MSSEVASGPYNNCQAGSNTVHTARTSKTHK